MKNILAICCALTLIACGPVPSKPTAGKNSDFRTINGMGIFGGNVAEAAARACDSEGKKLNVITTTTQTGITGTNYPVIVFKCV